MMPWLFGNLTSKSSMVSLPVSKEAAPWPSSNDAYLVSSFYNLNLSEWHQLPKGLGQRCPYHQYEPKQIFGIGRISSDLASKFYHHPEIQPLLKWQNVASVNSNTLLETDQLSQPFFDSHPCWRQCCQGHWHQQPPVTHAEKYVVPVWHDSPILSLKSSIRS